MQRTSQRLASSSLADSPRLADGGYAGNKRKDALRRIGKWTIEIVKRSDIAKRFEILPHRWIVERTLAWSCERRSLAHAS